MQYRVKPYYYYQCDLAEGTAHFRTSVAKGIEIYESLRGHTTGFAVPTYIIDAIGGGGKTPVFPNYVISQAPGKIILRNYEGVISKYTEPDDYVEGDCHCEDCEAERERLGVAGCSTPPRAHARGRVGRAHAEGRRPQEPHGRRLRAGQGLRRRDASGVGPGASGGSPPAAGGRPSRRPPTDKERTCPKSSSSPSG